VVDDVYLALARLLPLFFDDIQIEPGIHSTSVIHSTAAIADGCSIGANVVIEQKARIGNNAVLFPGVYVGRNASIGDDTIVYPNAYIGYNVNIGKRTIIHAGAVIGSDGFGFARDRDKYVKIMQLGSVIIGDDVEIGANSTVDRGSMGMTVVENGVKIDNLVHIAHNAYIGENTALAAQTGIAGSTRLGKRVVFGGQAGATSHVTIGDDVTVTSRGSIMKNVSSNQIISGFPQMPHRDWKRNQVALRRVPEWTSKLKSISQRLKKLEADVASLSDAGKELSGDRKNSNC
jgi:UDP-3-O-[3-hydroxymyristoyl] glucosamine N-acyltransferase